MSRNKIGDLEILARVDGRVLLGRTAWQKILGELLPKGTEELLRLPDGTYRYYQFNGQTLRLKTLGSLGMWAIMLFAGYLIAFGLSL